MWRRRRSLLLGRGFFLRRKESQGLNVMLVFGTVICLGVCAGMQHPRSLLESRRSIWRQLGSWASQSGPVKYLRMTDHDSECPPRFEVEIVNVEVEAVSQKSLRPSTGRIPQTQRTPHAPFASRIRDKCMKLGNEIISLGTLFWMMTMIWGANHIPVCSWERRPQMMVATL
jgi:hypothetical protein